MMFYIFRQFSIKTVMSVFCLSLLFGIQAINAQINSNEKDAAIGMLDITKDSIKKNYYDPTYRGLDLEAVFSQAKAKIKAATTRDELMAIVAQTSLSFDDSHTFFIPPSRSADVEYGWRVSMMGDDCYVTAVKPQSDAEAKALKVGDRVIAIDGFAPTKDNLWKMFYRYYSLAPSRSVRLAVQSPNESKSHVIDVTTKITKTSNLVSYEMIYTKILRKGWDVSEDRYYEFGKNLLVWKLSSFTASEKYIDEMMGKAKNFDSLIIDLRDNGGGYVDTMKRLVGYFSESDLKIADEKKRKSTKPITAKTRGSDVFKGKLIVLVNNNSASASEIFARTIQLQKRGQVIGDQTSGAVMESINSTETLGVGSILYFGISVTVADLIMPDGKSLEKTGVTPDMVGFPTGKELAEQKDPILSFAAKQLGVDISPEKAGTMFPIKW
jgi:carboxyl-terminal processing protease